MLLEQMYMVMAVRGNRNNFLKSSLTRLSTHTAASKDFNDVKSKVVLK